MGDQVDYEIAVLRFFTLIVTLIYFFGGLLFLCLGTWLFFNFKGLDSEYYFSLMVIASVYLSWSILTFWGVYHGPPATMYLYGCILACMFVTTLGGFTSIAVYRDTIRKEVQAGFNTSIITSNPPNVNIEFAQRTMKCCGLSNYTDWVRYSPQRVIPSSCCVDPERCVTANYNDVYQQGCIEAITAYFDTNLSQLAMVAATLAVFPIFGSTITCFLGRKLEQERIRDIVLIQ